MTTEETTTTPAWIADTLGGLEAPVSASNVEILTLWAKSEGTPATWNNWLATEYPGFTGTNALANGVKRYPSESKGVAATIATLRNGDYGPVVAALVADAGLAAAYEAINGSPWCKDCEDGHYPSALWSAVQAAQSSPPPSPAPPAAPTATQGDPVTPTPTTVVASWSVPGTAGGEYFELVASGGLNAYGGATIGALEYVATSNVPGERYHFGPTVTEGVWTYLQLPDTERQGDRWFVAMEVLSYKGVGTGA